MVIEIHDILGNIEQPVLLNSPFLFIILDIPELLDIIFFGFKTISILQHLFGKPVELDQLFHVEYPLVEKHENTVHLNY